MKWDNTNLADTTDLKNYENEITEIISTGVKTYAVEDSDITSPVITSLGTESGKGTLEIIGVATEDIVIGSGESLVVSFQDSDDDATFEAINAGLIVYSNNTIGTILAGTELFRWVVPTTIEDYVKPVITATATGKISIYSDGLWQDKHTIAKEYLGVDIKQRLLAMGKSVDYSEGESLLDLINNAEIFKVTFVYLWLSEIYRDLSRGDRDGIFYLKSTMYMKMYATQLNKEWNLIDFDNDLDGETDEYTVDEQPQASFTR